MKVSGLGPTNASTPTRRADRAKGRDSGFAQHLADTLEDAEAAAHAEGNLGVGRVDSLLAAQEVTDATDEEARGRAKRRLVQRGDAILNSLDELRHGLLIGNMPKERLLQLAQTVRSRRERADDPQLAQILDEIELRAEVELAKFTR